MRDILQACGLVLIVVGISGAIDHLAVQPFLGIVLNFVNRVVVAEIDAFDGYEVYANLAVSAVGLGLIAASRLSRS